MDPISVEYEITISDYRKASYYALFIRNRKALRIMFVVLIVAVLYAIGAYMQLGEANPLVFLIAGAYLIWGIFLFAGAEKTILSYIKNPDNLFGLTYSTSFEKTKMRITLHERNFDFSCSLHNLACVFELNELFLLYSSGQEVFIVPKRAFSDKQVNALRQQLSKTLQKRFYTRFK